MASAAVRQTELIYLRAATKKGLGPFYYMWVVAAKAAIQASLLSGSSDMAGEVADLGLNAMELLFRQKKDKKAQAVAELGVGLLQQAIQNGDEAMARTVAARYATTFEKLATKGGLEGKIRQVVEIRTAHFIQAVVGQRIEEAYSLSTVAAALLMAAVREKTPWLANDLSKSLVDCLSTAVTRNQQLAVEIVRRLVDTLHDCLRNDNKQDATYLFRITQELSVSAVRGKELEVEKIFTSAWIKALIKINSAGHEKITIEFVAEMNSNILAAIKSPNQLGVGERSQVGLDIMIAAVIEGEPKVLEVISGSWIHLLQRLVDGGKGQAADRLIDERRAIFRSSITDGIPESMNTISKAITTTLRSAIKLEGISIAIARSISRSWVLALDEAESGGGQVSGLVHERNAAFRDAIAAGNNEEAVEVSQVGVELVLAAINGGKLKLARELSLAWIAALGAVTHSGYRGALDGLVEFKTKTLTEELVAGNNQEAELITKVWVELLLAASANGHSNTMQTLSRCWTIALRTAIQRGYQHTVDTLMESRTRTFVDAIQRRSPTEADALSMAGMELLNAAIRLNDAGLKNSLSRSWVEGLSRAIMVDRSDAERLVQSRKRNFDIFVVSGSAVEADELVKGAVEILRVAQLGGNPAVVRLIKENWGPLLQ